ncbi:MAG: DMT family transporter [Proteobacteria bacterium TMED51]|nr:MAG: DMT family transporter [Proteobacteria bacterium TMED51]
MTSVSDQRAQKPHLNLKAVLNLLLAMFCISIMDTVIKMLSDGYALHQLVFIRAAVSVVILLPILLRHGVMALNTQRPGAHLLRGSLLVMANMTFYTGLASLPLAQASAVVFFAPVIITVFSWYFLGEEFSPFRWLAVLLGLTGMMLVVQPFSVEIELAYLWPLAAAFCYAGFTTITRHIGRTESAPLLAVTAQGAFLLASGLIGLSVGHGQFAGFADPGIEFLLRAWRWPSPGDVVYLAGIGGLSAITALSLSFAYRSAQASFLAPFEYAILPLVLLWGYLVFSEFPDALALFGIVLIAIGGLVVWLDGKRQACHQAVRAASADQGSRK